MTSVIFVSNVSSSLSNTSNVVRSHVAIVQPLPPPPWYVQYLPEFIIVAGIVATVLTFYFSPELRRIVRRLRGYP
ncbi:MAG: hypothetical protein QXY87_13890 [Saccharolobus sp.]|uniref:hypothetical protein n=1 Tax=Saccharolobus TaxID=2100760 RepID=UPI001F0E8A25|nr:hypothetical protein [Saccharolobus shibatae]MCH4816241.1 hypothetical protein [Saccharolobus shibatae]